VGERVGMAVSVAVCAAVGIWLRVGVDELDAVEVEEGVQVAGWVDGITSPTLTVQTFGKNLSCNRCVL
jgi:hypothetical protein